jgi:hypothetical protein
MPKMWVIAKQPSGSGYEVIEADDSNATSYPDLKAAKKAVDKDKKQGDRVVVEP